VHFVAKSKIKRNPFLYQSPTGHPNQIAQANERQALNVV